MMAHKESTQIRQKQQQKIYSVIYIASDLYLENVKLIKRVKKMLEWLDAQTKEHILTHFIQLNFNFEDTIHNN